MLWNSTLPPKSDISYVYLPFFGQSQSLGHSVGPIMWGWMGGIAGSAVLPYEQGKNQIPMNSLSNFHGIIC